MQNQADALRKAEEGKATLTAKLKDLEEERLSEREDAVRKQAQLEQAAQANTSKGAFFSDIMEHFCEHKWAKDEDRLQKAKILSTHFARLALVQLGNATVNNYNIVSFFSSVDQVTKHGDSSAKT